MTTTIDLGPPEAGARGDREGAAAVDRPDAALVAIDVAHRRRGRDGRRPQLPPEPVQPRDAGRAPARLGVQAVRARGRASGRDRAVDDLRLAPGRRSTRADGSGTSTTSRTRASARSTSRRRSRYSDNTVFAQLTNVDRARERRRGGARRWGSRRRSHPYFSIGLGAEPATPLEMARAYATLADGGYRLDTLALRRTSRTSSQSVASPSPTSRASTRRTRTRRSRVGLDWLTNGNAAIEDQMLRGVVQYGTGTAAQLPGWRRRRQDRHDRELRRRLVRRLHARISSPPSGSATRTS